MVCPAAEWQLNASTNCVSAARSLQRSPQAAGPWSSMLHRRKYWPVSSPTIPAPNSVTVHHRLLGAGAYCVSCLHRLFSISNVMFKIKYCCYHKRCNRMRNKLLCLQGDTVKYFLDNLKRIGQPVSFHYLKY